MSSKLALVTGASSGIGRDLALCLAGAGMRVVIAGRREAALADVAAKNELIRPCVADVGTAEGRAALKAIVGDEPLHILVHSAGVNSWLAPLSSVDIASFRAMFSVNTEPALFLTQDMIPNLKAADGDARVLMVSSGADEMHIPTMGLYGVTKAALKMVWMVLRDELAEFAAVGYCLPGLVDTEMVEKMVAADGFALKDIIDGRKKGGDIHTSSEVAEWMSKLLHKDFCDAKTFRERVHNIDLPEHQMGSKVTLTTEAQLLSQPVAGA